MKLFRARGKFDRDRKLGPWLLRIAGNACRDRLRRRRVIEQPIARFDASERDVLQDMPDTRHEDPAAQLGPTVRAELDRLSDKVRLPLELKYQQGMTNGQIAASLGISVSNVKVQIARGKDILASRLQSLGESFGRRGATVLSGRAGVSGLSGSERRDIRSDIRGDARRGGSA